MRKPSLTPIMKFFSRLRSKKYPVSVPVIHDSLCDCTTIRLEPNFHLDPKRPGRYRDLGVIGSKRLTVETESSRLVRYWTCQRCGRNISTHAVQHLLDQGEITMKFEGLPRPSPPKILTLEYDFEKD